LGKYLKGLKNLEDFTLNFEIFNRDSTRWFIDVVKVLPSLRRLRNIQTSSQSTRWFLSAEEKLVSAVSELKNVWSVHIHFETPYYYYRELMTDLRNKIMEINKNQSMKCQLMF